MSQHLAAHVRTLIERGAIPQAIEAAQSALHDIAGETRGPLLLELASACNSAGRDLDGLRAGVAAGEVFKAGGDRGGTCDALVRVATALRGAGDHASAISTLEQAEDMVRAGGDPRRLTAVLRAIGVSSSIVGRHQHALSSLAEAVEIAHGVDGDTELLTGRLSLNNARNRQAVSLPEDAPERQALLAAALADWQALADDCRAASHHRLELMARGNHAITLHEVGRHREAIEELQGLLAGYRTAGLKPNEGLCLAELGHCHQALGEDAAARENYLQAIAILEDGGTLDDLQAALEGLSRVEEALGRHAASLAALRRVRAIDRNKSDEAARNALMQRELRIELARLTSQWAQHAVQDALTGLGNRRALERWMEEHLPRVEHGEPLTLLLMDLDHFKRINDRHGHAIGDEVLRRVARVIQHCCRGRDLAVRYGGEEFVLALASVDAAGALRIAHRVRESVAAQPWHDVASGLQVSVSIGLARAVEAVDAQALLTLADKRLYAAKYAGRNQVVAAG